MVGRAPTGMGISEKNLEMRCHNFSLFGRQYFQKRDFRKARNCGSAFKILGMPIRWRSPDHNVLLKFVGSVP
jgi:hypothetical protein